MLALAASLPAIATTRVARAFYFFDVTLTSSAPGMTRLSWDSGTGYTEADSSAQPVRMEPAPVRYRYLMPAGKFNGLRLAPNNRASRLTLSKLRVVDKWGGLVREIDVQTLQPRGALTTKPAAGGAIEVSVEDGDPPAALDVAFASPLVLPVTFRMALSRAAPTLLICLALGLALSARAIRISLEPLWRRPRLAIVLAAAGATLIQAYPVVFLGRSFVSPANGGLMLYGDLPTLPGSSQATYADTMGSDVGAMLFQHLYYPVVEREALLGHGELPLWNRYSLAGEPLLGQGQSMFGDPLNLLTIFARGAAWAWDIRFLIAHWLLAAGLGFGVWRLSRNPIAAAIVAGAGAHLGLYLFRLNHPAIFTVAYAAWIPWAWLGLVGAQPAAPTENRRTPPATALLWLVIVNACVLMSGTAKEAVVAIGCLNAAGALLVLLLPEFSGRGAVVLGHAAAAGGVFALLTAPHWLTFLDALQVSVTRYGAPGANAYAPSHLAGFFDELFSRESNVEEHVAAPALNFVFLLGLLAWLVANPWRDRAGRAVALAAFLPFAFAYGIVPAAVVERTPFVRNIGHVGDVFAYPLLILVSLLAGCGFAGASNWTPGQAWRRAAAGITIAAILIGTYFAFGRGESESPFFLGYVGMLALGLVGIALGAGWWATGRGPAALRVGLILGVPLLLWRFGQYPQSAYNRYVFVPGERADFHATSAAVGLIDRRLGAPARVIGWDLNLFPSYNTMLGWESLYGVDALRSPYYESLTAALGLERVSNWDSGTPEANALRLQRAHDLLNVRYSVGNVHGQAAGLERVADLDLAVYESGTAWPRAFFTDRLATYDGTAEAFARQLASADARPFAAIARGMSGPPTLPDDLASRTVKPASDYRLTANSTGFTVDAPSAGVAVLTETFYPDSFQVSLDGKPAPYFRVNHAFKAVSIPSPGWHEITFTYRPRHFTLALFLAGAGLALGLAGWCRLRFAESRR